MSIRTHECVCEHMRIYACVRGEREIGRGRERVCVLAYIHTHEFVCMCACMHKSQESQAHVCVYAQTFACTGVSIIQKYSRL